MHKNILNQQQIELLPAIHQFTKEYYLVGGTAIALQLGHRRSIDFDLFSRKRIRRKNIKNRLNECPFKVDTIVHETVDELTIVINSVKMTFFNYPYHIAAPLDFEGIIKIPSLLDLAAMKAYALGQRAKWRDYVDLFFILRGQANLAQISARAKEVFATHFNEKLFRQQLCYFKDVDYQQSVEYMAKGPTDQEVKDFLCDVATTPF